MDALKLAPSLLSALSPTETIHDATTGSVTLDLTATPLIVVESADPALPPGC